MPPVTELRPDAEATTGWLTGTLLMLVGWIEADGRACPTRPIVRMSDSEMVLLPPDAAAFSGNRNCSKSFLLREAVNEADDGDPVVAGPVALLLLLGRRPRLADEDRADEALSLLARCLSTPLVVHWNRSELSEALSLDESGLGEAGAMQLADLAGRGPRKLLPPALEATLLPAPLAVDPVTLELRACRLLEADETRRGMMTTEWISVSIAGRAIKQREYDDDDDDDS